MLSAIKNTFKVPVTCAVRFFQTSGINCSEADRKWDRKSIPADDEGVQGEKIVDIDSVIKQKQNLFPTIDSDEQIFNSVAYKNLPICNIRVSSNNTIITLTEPDGTVKLIRSCGIDGFKNTKKGTNIAAQTTAIALAGKAIARGLKTVRVQVRGLGPGRLASIKGLQMGGLDIVSITDTTRVSWNPPRPRKARRL